MKYLMFLVFILQTVSLLASDVSRCGAFLNESVDFIEKAEDFILKQDPALSQLLTKKKGELVFSKTHGARVVELEVLTSKAERNENIRQKMLRVVVKDSSQDDAVLFQQLASTWGSLLNDSLFAAVVDHIEEKYKDSIVIDMTYENENDLLNYLRLFQSL